MKFTIFFFRNYTIFFLIKAIITISLFNLIQQFLFEEHILNTFLPFKKR